MGEGKWGRTKYRRIPESEGDWKGRVPKCSLPRKLFKTRDLELPFLRDLFRVVRRTPRDTPVLLYTRTSPFPMKLQNADHNVFNSRFRFSRGSTASSS